MSHLLSSWDLSYKEILQHNFCDADNVDAVDVADDDKLESEGGKSVQAFKKL